MWLIRCLMDRISPQRSSQSAIDQHQGRRHNGPTKQEYASLGTYAMYSIEFLQFHTLTYISNALSLFLRGGNLAPTYEAGVLHSALSVACWTPLLPACTKPIGSRPDRTPTIMSFTKAAMAVSSPARLY